MRIIKFLLIVVALLALILVSGGYLVSPKFTVSRSVLVQAPVEKVYPLVADPKAWAGWSVWNRRDPAMQMSYSGPPSGAGAGWAWKSKSEGNGRMVFTAAQPNSQVDFDLFFDDFGTVSRGSLLFEPAPTSTRVTWVMNGDMGSNPLLRWFALFGDKMVGSDFEAGLVNLKQLAEKK